MKRTGFWLALVVLIIGGIFGTYYLMKDPYANLEVWSDDIDWDRPKTVGPVEEDPELLVVIGTFTGHREKYERTIPKQSEYDTDMILRRTKSMVKVEQVLKLAKGQKESELLRKKIPVIEDCRVVDGYYASTEKYKWMNEDGRYLLILRMNTFGDGYNINNLYGGKFDLNLKEKAQDHASIRDAFYDPQAEYMGSGEELDDFYKMKDEVIQKYNL